MNLEHEIKNLRVIKAEIKDVYDILTIKEKCGLSQWQFEDYRQEIVREGSLILIAKIENKTVGFLMTRSIIDEVDILNVGVYPKYRELGIGSFLLNDFLERMSETPAESVWLEVRESNFQAISFYQKRGFQHIQVRKNFYAQPVENAIIMRRGL